jgi:thioredoxin 1
MQIVTSADFESEVLKSDKPVLVEFFATWCQHCKFLAPTLDKIAAERAGLKVVKVDVDASPELAAKYFVTIKPTMVIVRDGKAVAKHIAEASKGELTEWIDNALARPASYEIDLASQAVVLSDDEKKTLRDVFTAAARNFSEPERKSVERGLDSGRTFKQIEYALSADNKVTLNDVIQDVQKNGFGLPKSLKL